MSTVSLFGRWKRRANTLRARFRAFTPYEKWKLIHFCGDKTFNLIGVNVMNDCTLSWRTLIPGLAVAIMFLAQMYTLWLYWNINKISAIQSMSVSAMQVQVNICGCMVLYFQVLFVCKITFSLIPGFDNIL